MFNSGIVGYVYRANTYCTNSECLPLATGDGEDFDGWSLAPGIYMTTEDNLNEIASAFGINRQDEYSFDSDYFPKVILTHSGGDARCATCGADL